MTELAAAVREVVGERPTIVLGSRALGTARPDSDLDAYVVLPTWRLPLELGRLRGAAGDLEARLGVPVSLNPLPAARLRRPGERMLVWKLRREGRVLVAPSGWTLGTAGAPPAGRAARCSYALSGIGYLLEAGPAVLAAAETLPPAAAHATAKALLHAAQLALVARGSWHSTLPDAVAALGGPWPSRLAAVSAPQTWFQVRAALLPDVATAPERRARAAARGLQWAALRALRGAPPRRPPLGRPSPAAALTRCAALLAAAVRPGGADPGALAAARAALPRAVASGAPEDWAGLTALVVAELAHADPLVGV